MTLARLALIVMVSLPASPSIWSAPVSWMLSCVTPLTVALTLPGAVPRLMTIVSLPAVPPMLDTAMVELAVVEPPSSSETIATTV